MKCKKCNKEFHACSSCYLPREWEWHYCTEECWEESRQYKISHNLITTFLDTLVLGQLEMFSDILELDDDYEFIIEKLVSNLIERRN